MDTTTITQISQEHKHLLNLCEKIENLLSKINYENNCCQIKELNNELRHILINIHHPRDKHLAHEISRFDITKTWIGLLQNFHYPVILDAINQLTEIMNAVSQGEITDKQIISKAGQDTVNKLRSAIAFEEQVCLSEAINLLPDQASKKQG